MSDLPELWMNSPVGYLYAQKIAKSDINGLKSFLINTTSDELLQQMIREMTDQQLYENYERNNFTFDEEWYGARLLPWQTI